MFRKLLNALGTRVRSADAEPREKYEPYATGAANAIYNLLFCDEPAAFAAKPGQSPMPWQRTLAATPVDVAALEAMAADANQEGRIRYLACQRLRAAGHAVRAKQLLGVIVEVPLDDGLDTLAAYREGGVRYIDQAEKIFVAEGMPQLLPLVGALFAAAQPVVDAIGPWDKERLPPPARGRIRMSFLVSDGLYFGDGPMADMQRDAMAAPVIARATELLQAVVAAGTK